MAILQGQQKRYLKDVVKYYVETTGLKYNDFILNIDSASNKPENTLTYPEWLAHNSLILLREYDITYKDIIENKDTINATINEASSRNEGEFFTPLEWAEDGRKYLQNILGNRWGTVNIWEASCYSTDTEVLTKRGWKHYADLLEDDLIYSLNPKTGEGEYVGYTNLFVKAVPNGEKLIRIKTETTDLLVTQDHAMWVSYVTSLGERQNWVKRTASQVLQLLTKEGVTHLAVPKSAEISDENASHLFSQSDKAFHSNDKDFMELLGYTAFKGLVGDYCGLHADTTDQMNWVAERLRRLNKPVEFLVETCEFRLGDDDFARELLDCQPKLLNWHELTKQNEESYLLGLLTATTGNLHTELPYAVNLTLPRMYMGTFIHLEQRFTNQGYWSNIILSEDESSIEVILTKREYDIIESCNVHETLYVGDVWDLTLDKNHIFLVRRNGLTTFSGNCGSGNLLRDANYPPEKLFMSSLLEEDITIINSTPEFKGVTAFKLDFLNGIDLDDKNMNFSDNLPENLRKALENDEPLVFYMNPPYKVIDSKTTDMGAYMSARGMAKCALDLFHQFMYRMVLIKRAYNLSDVTLGIFGPVTMFHSKMIEPLYEEFKDDFTFNSGMCFDAGDFANTSESVDWIIGYTCWTSKKQGDVDKPVVLEAKKLINGVPTVVGSRLISYVNRNIHEWVQPTDVIRYVGKVPTLSTYSTFTGLEMKVPSNALAYLMSSNFVLRATRRACVTTFPTNDATPITQDNFWRAVGSYGARRAYATNQNPYDNCQYYSAPNESVEGYEQWLCDALVVFLFDTDAQHASYRNAVEGDNIITKGNPFFPFSKEIARGVVTDPRLLADIDSTLQENDFLLHILSKAIPMMSDVAKELFEYCAGLILKTLNSPVRSEVGYVNWLDAWDAGFVQIRTTEGVLTKEEIDLYLHHLSKLKHHLYDGCYKFGFISDSTFSGSDNIYLDNIDDLEEVE